MTREELARVFMSLPGRCKFNCPFSAQCQNGDFCVLKEAALVMLSDASKIRELTEQNGLLKSLGLLQLNYTKFMEERCFEYYDMIHAYNGGVVKQMRLSPKRKMAIQRRKRAARKMKENLKQPKRVEDMDGNPDYALKTSENTVSEHYPEVFI